jgi:hypothetical protein
MADGIEGWRFLDVESGLLPDESAPSILPGGGKGRIVVLAATPFARTDGWANRAGVLIAGEWAREGLRIFLMDLALEDPSLHEAIGLPNGEGVSDAFLFGASVQHIAKPALDNAIFFAPAGAPPADPEEVLGHPRWNDLAGGFSEADATLLLFLPTDIQGAGKILSRATDIIFLAARGESADDHLGPASIKVVTTLGPLGTPFQGDRETDAAMGLETEDAAPAEPYEGLLASSDFDLEGGLELAEGFGVEEPEEGFSFEGEVPFHAEEAGAESEGAGERVSSQGPTDAEKDSAVYAPEEEAVEADVEQVPGFGKDLVMGASLADQMEAGDDDSVDGETVHQKAPDFAADFVDLPSSDPLSDGTASGGQFGEDLVQGPDFGTSPMGGSEVGISEPSAPEPPPFEAPRAPPREVPEPSRRKPPRRKPPKKRIPWGLLAGVGLALAVLAAAIGTALGYLDVPGFAAVRDYFSEIPDPPLTLAGPQANEEVLRYSLVLFTYGEDELADARELLDALQDRLPELLLTLVPSEADGLPVYTLLAGPAVDRVEAENLRAPIAEVLVREDPASWSVRETPRAFYLGERGTLAEAEDYLQSVTTGGLEAYILHVTFPDPEGSESYQVLTGAFAGVRDARLLQLTLEELGFRDAPLIERRGRLPE